MFSAGLLGFPDTQWAAVKIHLWGVMIIVVIVVVMVMMVIMLMMVIALMMVIMVMIMIMIMIHIEDQAMKL